MTLVPVFGIAVFLILYFAATIYYPGGSHLDKNSTSFSWEHNYWCNLLNEQGLNGQPNKARPVAMIAMFVLSIALASFWYIFPVQAGLRKPGKQIIQVSGLLSIMVGFFLFTDIHDIIINIASFFGLVAMVGTFIGLLRLKWKGLFYFGLLNLALGTLNSISYYGDVLMYYLPLIQKFTFLSFLLWFCLIAAGMFKMNRKPVISNSSC